MARLIALLLLCLAGPALAQQVTCKADLVPGGGLASGTPSDVVVDAQKRVFLLYGREGGVEVLDPQGKTLMKLRSGGGEDSRPTHFRALSLWTGPGAPPTVLASQDGPEGATWVLWPQGNRLQSLRLRGAPNPIGDVALVAREGERLYVLDCSNEPSRLYIYNTSGGFVARGSFPGLGRVRRMTLDKDHNLYAMNDKGLVVYNRQGSRRYTITGARAFYISRDNRLVGAGSDWVRKFDLAGNLLVEGRPAEGVSQPEAISLAADGSMYAYYAGGKLVHYDAQGEVADEFSVNPGTSQPGYGLDAQGRLFSWTAAAEQLVMRSSAGKVLARASYVAGGVAPDKLINPVDLALAADGTVWIAEAGSCRLQRWQPDKGWLEPVSIGIRGGSARAVPLQIKPAPRGELLLLVAPTGGGQLVLQRRDAQGRLQGQKDLGPIQAGAVAKLAVLPNGETFFYRSDARPRPTLEHMDARGNHMGVVGGTDPNFTLSGAIASGIFLKPEEDLLPYKDGLLMATGDKLVYLDGQMKITKVLTLRHSRGAAGRRVANDFGGCFLTADGVLYLTDLANMCVHKVLLR